VSGCILDNLSSDKVSGVEEAMHVTGAILHYLPPYSPDFNPIEKLFSELKALLGKAALNDLSMHCRRKSVTCSMPLHQTNAQTSSPLAVM